MSGQDTPPLRALTLRGCAACGKEALTVSKGLQAGCEHLHATRKECHIEPPGQPSFRSCDRLQAYHMGMMATLLTDVCLRPSRSRDPAVAEGWWEGLAPVDT